MAKLTQKTREADHTSDRLNDERRSRGTSERRGEESRSGKPLIQDDARHSKLCVEFVSCVWKRLLERVLEASGRAFWFAASGSRFCYSRWPKSRSFEARRFDACVTVSQKFFVAHRTTCSLYASEQLCHSETRCVDGNESSDRGGRRVVVVLVKRSSDDDDAAKNVVDEKSETEAATWNLST